MALEALLLQRRIDQKRAALNEVNARIEERKKNASRLEEAIEEARAMPEETEEEIKAKREAEAAIDAEVEQYASGKEEAEKDAEAAKELQNEIEELEQDLEKQETEQETPDENEPEEEKREVNKMSVLETRDKFFNMTYAERDALVRSDATQTWLGEIRAHMREKRAIQNVGVTIPEDVLPILRQKIEGYSKLMKYVTVRKVSGKARQPIMSGYQEAIWTECCAALNELNLAFYQEEYDCFKVAGYYALCNANAEDSDLNLLQEVLTAIGQAIGLAIDKAIVYGRNTSANQKMPLGIVTRLVQTAAPSGYPAEARPWVDLHETNVITLAAGLSGTALIKAIVKKSGAAKGKYSTKGKMWFMNETTKTHVQSETITTDAQGNIVSGTNNQMPVVGGAIEELEFLPDNVILGGYMDLYVLAERAGNQFATSEHVRFLNDQTVMKGVGRYDGGPAIPEGFIVIGLEGTTPTSEMTFAADVANQGA